MFTNLLLGYIFTGSLSLILPATTVAMVGGMHGATRPGPARNIDGFWPLDFQFPMADSTNISEFTSMATVIHHLLQIVAVWLSTLQSIRHCVKDDSGGLIWLVSRLSTSWFSGGLEEPHFPITDHHSILHVPATCRAGDVCSTSNTSTVISYRTHVMDQEAREKDKSQQTRSTPSSLPRPQLPCCASGLP